MSVAWTVAALVAAVVVAAPPGRAQSAEAVSEPDSRLVTLVLPLTPQRVNSKLAATVTEVLAAELAKRPELKVVTIADLEALFEAEMIAELMGSDDGALGSEIAGAIDAQRIIAGSLGRIENEYILTVRWIDAVYGEPLSITSDVVSGGEAGLLVAAHAAVAALLYESAELDVAAAERKRSPTFWTVEIGPGVGRRAGAESYNLGFTGLARVSWGGWWSPLWSYLYAIIGLQAAYVAGKVRNTSGTLRYDRVDTIPFFEVRVSFPFANRRRSRFYLGSGIGLVLQRHKASQSRGRPTKGWSIFPELRVSGGVWHRWDHRHSIYGGYRLRVIFAGDGGDPISELVRLGSTKSTPVAHEVEFGWATHF